MRPRTAAALAVLLPAALLLATWPFGDTRINDDWQMYLSAFEFARSGTVTIPNYSAMGMVGWTVPAGIVAALGGESFVLMRCLTLLTLPLAGWLAFDTAREWELPPARALFVGLLVATTPVLFWLSTTFMTDAPWHAGWIAGLWAWSRALRRGDLRWFVIGGIVVAWVAWIRLPVVALPLALIVTVALSKGLPAELRRRSLWTAALTLLAGPIAFWIWYRYVHGATIAYEYKSAFSAADMFQRTPSGAFATVAYVGLFLLPAAPWLLARSDHSKRSATVVAGLAGVLALVQMKTGLLVGIHKTMPYLLNVAYNLGLGPINLTDVAREGGPPPVHLPGWTQIVLTVVTCVVGAALVWAACVRLVRALRARDDSLVLLAGVAVVLYVGAATLFSKPSAPLFDRYLVPLILPVTLMLARTRPGANDDDATGAATARTAAAEPKLQVALSWALLALVALYATAGTRDFHRFNDARFRLGNQAVELAGTPHRVDAGAAFNLYHNYEISETDADVRKLLQPSGWNGWLAYPEYVVATRKRPGTDVVNGRPVHFEVVAREPVHFLLGWKTWDLLLLRMVEER